MKITFLIIAVKLKVSNSNKNFNFLSGPLSGVFYISLVAKSLKIYKEYAF